MEDILAEWQTAWNLTRPDQSYSESVLVSSCLQRLDNHDQQVKAAHLQIRVNANFFFFFKLKFKKNNKGKKCINPYPAGTEMLFTKFWISLKMDSSKEGGFFIYGIVKAACFQMSNKNL